MRNPALALALVIPATLLLAAGSHASDNGNYKKIHVQEHVTNSTYIPVATLVGSPEPSNPGDYIAFDDPLFDPDTTLQVGHVFGVCTLVDVDTQIYACPDITYVLTGRGQIAAGGAFDGTGNPTSGPVLGGTGEFIGVRGTGRVQALAGGAVIDFVFTLSK